MITAKEARTLIDPDFELKEKIEKIGEAIERAARDGKTRLVTGYQYKKDPDLWIQGGYSRTKEWEKAKKILEELGYKVTFVYKELQFVDMYTVIEW